MQTAISGQAASDTRAAVCSLMRRRGHTHEICNISTSNTYDTTDRSGGPHESLSHSTNRIRLSLAVPKVTKTFTVHRSTANEHNRLPLTFAENNSGALCDRLYQCQVVRRAALSPPLLKARKNTTTITGGAARPVGIVRLSSVYKRPHAPTLLQAVENAGMVRRWAHGMCMSCYWNAFNGRRVTTATIR